MKSCQGHAAICTKVPPFEAASEECPPDEEKSSSATQHSPPPVKSPVKILDARTRTQDFRELSPLCISTSHITISSLEKFHCAHMHCDVDLRSRRMWAASYRLTRLIMNEDSHVPRGPDTGRERVLTQRRGNGDDGAGGGCARARASMLLRPLHLVWWLGWVSLGGA